MRFHLVAPPYLPVRKDVVQSAFVPLAYNMAVMLHRAGHTVTAYVAEGSDLPCTEQVTLLGEEDLCRWHGERDWRTSTWSDWNDTASEHWKKWLESVNQELSARYRYRDLVLLSLGSPYQLWSIPANAVVLYACGYDTPAKDISSGLAMPGCTRNTGATVWNGNLAGSTRSFLITWT